MKSFLLIKMFLELVEMTFGLVYSIFSLPEWQALKMTFFASCGEEGGKMSAPLTSCLLLK